MSNPLAELAKVGQSVWFDQMERKLLTSGKLQQMIDEDDLRGLTSNPTIFEKAIGGSEDYDSQLRELASKNKTRDEIYDELVLDDISKAADVFRPVYDRNNGGDGFVSIEVSPLLARNTEGTIEEAKRLFKLLGRPNVMIKIPATPEGIPAIEETIANGINVNITLIFSNDVYAQVIEAYLRGLERRAEKGKPIGDIASVASFFVSRIDAQADKQIEARLKDATDDAEKKALESLLGKVAIANAKLAYQLFKEIFESERFTKLRDKGARVQRPLWASTGTKNPKYSDVLYIESLIGSDTVNTVPPATYDAFRDHGKVALTLEENVDDARHVLETFAAKGFSLPNITQQLTEEGVKSFDASFESLLATIEARRDLAIRGMAERHTVHLATEQLLVDQNVQRADKEKFVERIWKKDATLWKNDDAHKKIIANALGWLTVVEEMQAGVKELVKFAKEIHGDFDDVVVLGMGGSSLCSEVTRRVFGAKEGWPRLRILDSTVPSAVQKLEDQLNLERTLFMVASKSGTTTEPHVFHEYFYDRVKSVKGEKAGENFIAVTDPNTQLGKDAARDNFRKIFINPADIGGRYSALSYFGLVPAAISGIDVETLVDRAVHAAHVARTPSVKKNPPAMLGVIIGTLAEQGRNKLTLITPPPLDTLGLWIEQLVAESTGKEGKGILPVAGEPPIDVASYGKDRVFVSVRLRGSDETARLRELADAGHPVIDLILEDTLDLGEIFFVWEFATAVAGAILGIDAFDQPNVQESKDNTKKLLDEFRTNGKLTEQDVVGTPGDVTIYTSSGSRGPSGSGDPRSTLSMLLSMVSAGDYVALTEYFPETPERDRLIAQIRETIASELHVATTTGYGPRFLHSTGQLHKGGADNGVFLQLTADDAIDLKIPGEPFTFATLARAQALGDFQSLASRGRRALRIHLGNDVDRGLAWLASAVKEAVAKRTEGVAR
ncbi:MAG: transaldolase / glucose-6-phosphate isomerase [Acidobacteriota bacterium]|jgi:transaldolase/glucose-6-phosphate isomerase|nr:transaldolase / glucose-6-phosphate isomerase [Acidobacteriota bacterium]